VHAVHGDADAHAHARLARFEQEGRIDREAQFLRGLDGAMLAGLR